MSHFNELLDEIADMSREELMAIPPHVLSNLLRGLTPDQIKEVMLRKNIKIFGGLNEYLNDFFSKHTIERITAMPGGPGRTSAKDGTLFLFEKVLAEPDLNDENKLRIQEAINTLNALAGGGKRRNTRRQRNRRSRKHRR